MSLAKYFQFFGTLAAVLSPALVTFASLPPQLTTQLESQREVSLKFPDTSDRQAPSSTGGGGSRGIDQIASCIVADETAEAGEMPWQNSLQALMPKTDLSKTIAENPSVFVYVPKTTAKSAIFLVRDKNGEEIYRSEFVPPETPGIVQLTIPKTVSLEVEQEYNWELVLMCNPKSYFSPENEYVEGLFLRTQLNSEQQKQLDCVRQAPDLQNLLEFPERQSLFSCVRQAPELQNLLNSVRQTPEQRELLDRLKESPEQAKLYVEALVYANAKIWHETIDNIAQLSDAHPQEWQELLASVGLEDLAQEKLLNCCTAD
ncbi:MAG: DUF928 domain-containing protein [Symploca sp. SIO2E6]|nr:DUF928 domain-containing protein [Symploca sp. SIO2E6]